MVGTCVVYGCTNRQEKGGNISFFHFPHKNPPVLKQWANAVNRLHWFPKDHSLICSVHFKESCFIVRPGKRGRLLKDGAVPTEFPTHPSHLQHQTHKRKSPKKRDIQEPLMNESPSKKVKKRTYVNRTLIAYKVKIENYLNYKRNWTLFYTYIDRYIFGYICPAFPIRGWH